MIYVYGYRYGCSACTQLKTLLTSHNLEFTFIEVEKGNHPFKTVPQSFYSNGTVIGDFGQWKSILLPNK